MAGAAHQQEKGQRPGAPVGGGAKGKKKSKKK